MSSEIYKPSEEELALLKRWYAPDVGESVSDERTNALGMKVSELNQPKPKPEPVVITEDIEPETLSAQSLQEIKQQAQEQGYQEGLAKGKEEGLLKGHQEGYEQGLEQGLEEGKTQGFEQAKPEISKRIDMLDKVTTSFSEPLAQQQKAIEESLLQLALTLSRKVIHCEITQSSQPIIQAVNEGIKTISLQEPIIIKLNPSDIDAVQELYNDEQQAKSNLTLESDPSLATGDCLLEAVSSSVSLQLEERINQVFDDFLNQPTPTNNTIELSTDDSNTHVSQDDLASLSDIDTENDIHDKGDINNNVTDTKLNELGNE